LESQAALLLRETAHPAWLGMPEPEFACRNGGEEAPCWDSKNIQQFKSVIGGHRGPSALLQYLVSDLAECYRSVLAHALSDGKVPHFPVPVATTTPSRVLADIALAAVSAVLHSQEEFQLQVIVFSTDEVSIRRALQKAWQQVCVQLHESKASRRGQCNCYTCGGIHKTEVCPHSLQSCVTDPDAALRAEATHRSFTPNAEMFTYREQPETSNGFERPQSSFNESHAAPPVQRAQQLSHQESRALPVYQPQPQGDSCPSSPMSMSPVGVPRHFVDTKATAYRAPQPHGTPQPCCCTAGCKSDVPEHGLSDGPVPSKTSAPRPKPLPANAGPLELLDVQPGFTEQELRAAYKRCILQWHPDRLAWHDSTEAEIRCAADMFRRVKDAYDLLSKSTC
jgi:hypothetical protein